MPSASPNSAFVAGSGTFVGGRALNVRLSITPAHELECIDIGGVAHDLKCAQNVGYDDYEWTGA